MRTMACTLILIGFCFSSTPSLAAQSGTTVVAGTAQAFVPVAAQVRQQMLPGGKYAALTSADKKSASTDLDEMQRLLQREGSVAKMARVNQIELFNRQEHLNGLLTGNLSSRFVCQDSAGTGTLFHSVTCATYAQRRAQDRVLGLPWGLPMFAQQSVIN